MSRSLSGSGAPLCVPDRTPPKPRGLAVAKIGGTRCAAAGGRVSDCPYKSRLWQSVWLAAYSRQAQQELQFSRTISRGRKS